MTNKGQWDFLLYSVVLLRELKQSKTTKALLLKLPHRAMFVRS